MANTLLNTDESSFKQILPLRFPRRQAPHAFPTGAGMSPPSLELAVSSQDEADTWLARIEVPN